LLSIRLTGKFLVLINANIEIINSVSFSIF
jgi:hypothetical protein